MRLRNLLLIAVVALVSTAVNAQIPSKTSLGTNRAWTSGNISVQMVGPTIVDGWSIHDGVRDAMTTWSNIANCSINFTEVGSPVTGDPIANNGINEYGWTLDSDNPYAVPGTLCTTTTIYTVLTGEVIETDTTCNAVHNSWPIGLYGLRENQGTADAETTALHELGHWLQLDHSVRFDDVMFPKVTSGYTNTTLSAAEQAYIRSQYPAGSGSNESISGNIRFADGTPAKYAYVIAVGLDPTNSGTYGAIAAATGDYTIGGLFPGDYRLYARPITTDPGVLSSAPYRGNNPSNLDFQVTFGSYAPAGSSNVDIVLTSAGSDPDPYEPNDTRADAHAINTGGGYSASMHVAGDVDWYRFQATTNECYMIQTYRTGVSTVATVSSSDLWSETAISVRQGSQLVALNWSREFQHFDPRSRTGFCSSLTGDTDIEVEQRNNVGGPGYFYSIIVDPIPNGQTIDPLITEIYPAGGWEQQEHYIWVEGSGFLPGATLEIDPPGQTWVEADDISVLSCDSGNVCSRIIARIPAAAAGTANVRVTNPNSRSDIEYDGFEYLPVPYGPMQDHTIGAFGQYHGFGKGACGGDYDNDGDIDLLKAGYNTQPRLFRNDDGNFSDVTNLEGLGSDPDLYYSSCFFADFDNDGDLDIYFTHVASNLYNGASNRVYYNQLIESGNAWFNLDPFTSLTGIDTELKTDAAFADFDNDGDIDVVLGYNSYAGTVPYDDALEYYRQDSNGTFTNRTSQSGLANFISHAHSLHVADFNDDGHPDLFVNGWASSFDRLYRNDGDGTFTNRTASSGLPDDSSCYGVALADFDNDGDIDIACGTANVSAGPIKPKLYVNNGSGSFSDRATQSGDFYDLYRFMTVLVPLDFNNDGCMDLYVGASETGWVDDRKDAMLLNNCASPPSFTDITDMISMIPDITCTDEESCYRDANAAVAFDRYEDGDIDVFVTGEDPSVYLYDDADYLWNNFLNKNPLDNNYVPYPADWIQIQLKGGNSPTNHNLSNRRGVGAKVVIIPDLGVPNVTEAQCLQQPLPAGVDSFTREMVGGNRSQSPMIIHQGFGNEFDLYEKGPDCINVYWPSGSTIGYTSIAANSRVILAEDPGRLRVVRTAPNSGSNAQSNPVTIIGHNFKRDGSNIPEVLFGATPAVSVTFVSENELTAIPPLWHPTGTVDITVTNPDGETDTLLAGYTFTGTNAYITIKDPFPEILAGGSEVPNDPEHVMRFGELRTGIIADGITELVIQLEVIGPGSVQLNIDDDGNLGNGAPPTSQIGTLEDLNHGNMSTGIVLTPVQLSDGRWVTHAVYRAPENFIRTAADESLATRPLHFIATYYTTGGSPFPFPNRVINLYRVPILFVGGIWSQGNSFQWPLVNDPRWISHRADYGATSARSFAENAYVGPQKIAELRSIINEQGIAGTRFFVFAHSMGGVLMKIFMTNANGTYYRPDNFNQGDIYGLVTVASPQFGAAMANFFWRASNTSVGPRLIEFSKSLEMDISQGGVQSLRTDSPDTLNISDAHGRFHAITAHGGSEMRALGIQIAESNPVRQLEKMIKFFNWSFEEVMLDCPEGDFDDHVVCGASQEAGLNQQYISDFHFIDLDNMAIHLDSVNWEPIPGARAEELVNTPITDGSTWAPRLPTTQEASPWVNGLASTNPNTPPIESQVPDTNPSQPVFISQNYTDSGSESESTPATNFSYQLDIAKQGDDLVLSWNGAPTRLLKSLTPVMTGALCIAISGSSYVDAGVLLDTTRYHYRVEDDTACTPTGSGLQVTGTSPTTGHANGGYSVTILGSNISQGASVHFADLPASNCTASPSGSSITCTTPPGSSGMVTVRVRNPGGDTAETTFAYTGPPDPIGSVSIIAPESGSSFAPGTTIQIAAIGSGGFVIDKAIAHSRSGIFSDTDSDPSDLFSTWVQVPNNVLGPMTINLDAKDVNGVYMTAEPIVINIMPPSGATLDRLRTHLPNNKMRMVRQREQQLRVYGMYSDGVEREVTSLAHYFITPWNPITGRNGTYFAEVDDNGMVTAKARGTTECEVFYNGKVIDVVIDVEEVQHKITLLGTVPFTQIFWNHQGEDSEGDEVTHDVIVGHLNTLRATGGNFTAAIDAMGNGCVVNDLPSTLTIDFNTPGPGNGYFYLMRDNRLKDYEVRYDWPGARQVGERDPEIIASPNACPD